MTRGFHGWWVVAAVFIVTFVGFGSAYTFGSFVVPLQREFALGRGTVSFVFGLASFLYFALGAITGPLADRIGARPLIGAGMALVGGGMIAAGLSSSAVAALSSYALGIGLGIGCAYVPAVAVVQRWFVRHRGLASGLAVSGIGVGTLVLPPLAQGLIDDYGWRAAYRILGLLALGLGAAATLLIRDDPHALGQSPDGVASCATPVAASGATLAEALRSAKFRRLYLGMLLIGVGAFVPFVHLIPYATAHGVSARRAALLIAVIGIGSTAGRFVLGRWADHVGRDRSFTLVTLGMGASIVGWAIAPGFPGLALFALVFGVVYGGWVALAPALIIDLFGARQAGTIIGIVYTSIAVGTLVGPGATGLVYEHYHAYGPGIVAAGLFVLAGAVAIRGLGRRSPAGPER